MTTAIHHGLRTNRGNARDLAPGSMRASASDSEAKFRPTLLLVEDDPRIALALQVRLGKEGFDVRQSSNAALGLLCASDAQHLPDLILLDISLPGMDGIQMAESLRESTLTRDIPVIFVTGTKDPNKRHRALEVQPVGVFDKPFDFPKLVSAIKGAVRKF